MKSPLSVIFVVSDISLRGGIERVIINTANYLSLTGARVTIISIFKTYQELYYKKATSVEVMFLSSYRYSRDKHWILPTILLAASRRVFKDANPCKVVVYHPSYVLPIISTGINYSQIVYSEHASYGATNIANDIIRKYVLKRVACVHVLNSTSEKFYRNIGVKAVVLPNAVTDFLDSRQFKNRQITNKPIKNTFRVLAAGRLDPVKSFSHVVEVATHVRSLTGITFNIIGDGPEHHKLSSLIQQASLTNISLSPATRSIQDHFLIAHCILLTSVSECFPMVLLEAMSFGVVPICYSDLDGPKDILKHDYNGFLVKRGDLYSISNRLIQLASDESLLCRFSRNAVNTSLIYRGDSIYPNMYNMLTLGSISDDE